MAITKDNAYVLAMVTFAGIAGVAIAARQRLREPLGGRGPTFDLTRVTGGLGATLWGRYIEPLWMKTAHTRVAWRGPNLRIAFLNGLHAGWTSEGVLRRAVARANAAHPHLILLGGDYAEGFDAAPKELSGLEPLRHLRAPYGVFAVLGDNDTDPVEMAVLRSSAIAERLAELGVIVLDNESRPVAPGVLLVGLGSLRAEDTDAGSAFAGRDPTLSTIVLAHSWRALLTPGVGRFDVAFAGRPTDQQALRTKANRQTPISSDKHSFDDGVNDWSAGGTLYVSRGLGESRSRPGFGRRPEVATVSLVHSPNAPILPISSS